jgi:hypothetical protein
MIAKLVIVELKLLQRKDKIVSGMVMILISMALMFYFFKTRLKANIIIESAHGAIFILSWFFSIFYKSMYSSWGSQIIHYRVFPSSLRELVRVKTITVIILFVFINILVTTVLFIYFKINIIHFISDLLYLVYIAIVLAYAMNIVSLNLFKILQYDILVFIIIGIILLGTSLIFLAIKLLHIALTAMLIGILVRLYPMLERSWGKKIKILSYKIISE